MWPCVQPIAAGGICGRFRSSLLVGTSCADSGLGGLCCLHAPCWGGHMDVRLSLGFPMGLRAWRGAPGGRQKGSREHSPDSALGEHQVVGGPSGSGPRGDGVGAEASALEPPSRHHSGADTRPAHLHTLTCAPSLTREHTSTYGYTHPAH